MDDSVVHIEFDISQLLELKHNTGDHIAVWTENKDAGTTALTTTLGLSEVDLTRCLDITANDPKGCWNSSCAHQMTLHVLFKHHIEIFAPVSRELILDFVQFVPSDSSICAPHPPPLPAILVKASDFIYGGGKQFYPTREANITDNSVIICTASVYGYETGVRLRSVSRLQNGSPALSEPRAHGKKDNYAVTY